MLHRKLNYSAYKLSELCHLLPSPALLWAGDKQQAVLAFNPINRMLCFTITDLQALVDQGLAPSNITHNNSNSFNTENNQSTKNASKGDRKSTRLNSSHVR